jgi:hypothetical protein
MIQRDLVVRCRWLLLLAVLIAIGLAGYTADRVFQGSAAARMGEGQISSDGWVGEQFDFQVPGFIGGINTFKLRFNPQRPGASEPPKVSVSLCDAPAREYTITSGDPVVVSVPLGCSPLRVSLRSLNFFIPPHEKTPRELGVQLMGFEVSSLLGLPLVSTDLLLATVFIVLSIVVLSMIAAAQVGLRPGLLGGLALLGILLFVCCISSDPDKLEPLAIVIASGLFGAVLYSTSQGDSGIRWRMTGPALGVAAVIGGAILRLYGINFGLPSNFHPDEVPKVNAIMRMVDSQSLNPDYFLHPSLLLYCAYGVNTVLHFFGLEGSFRDTAYLAGRLVSASAGIISIALTYQIGRRLFSASVGGVAASFLAVFPLHVTCSRYLKEDALLTFVVLSCVLTTIIAVQSGRKWLLLVAGLLAGCTAGTKYSGIVMVVVPASAPWFASRSWKPDWRWLPWAACAAAIAPLGFLATTPYALLHSAKFLKDFGSESRHMQTGHTVSITAWSQLWMYHFWRSIWPGISGATAIAGIVALGFLLRRARIEDLFVVGMVLLFYLPAEYVKAKPAPQPERYILPCLPFMAIAMAELLRQIALRGGTQRFVSVVSGLVLFALPLTRAISLAEDIKDDTRVRMAQWMNDNIPAGSQILMDWKPYCPRLAAESFQVQHIPRPDLIQDLDVKKLRKSGADYLILSSLFYNRYFSQPDAQPFIRQRFREVFQNVPVVVQFEAASGTYGFHNPTLTLFSLKEEDFARLEEEKNQKRRGEREYTSNEVRARAKW